MDGKYTLWSASWKQVSENLRGLQDRISSHQGRFRDAGRNDTAEDLLQTHVFEERSGIGIQQKVAFSLPLLSEIIRLWLTLLDREHESRENHGTQNSRCKPSCLTVTGLSCGF
jgi:hypothetical protein